MMKDTAKRKITLTGGALALASLGFAAARVAKRGVLLEITQDFTVPARDVIELISRVEREKEFIPFVSSVDVLDRQDDEVAYRVKASAPAPWWVIYRKWWSFDQKWVAWQSQSGSYGLSHKGEIRFEDIPGGCRARLTTDYRFSARLFGGPVTLGSKVFVRSAMSTWLKRLSVELSEKSGVITQPNVYVP